jgi:hypothetical protein
MEIGYNKRKSIGGVWIWKLRKNCRLALRISGKFVQKDFIT